MNVFDHDYLPKMERFDILTVFAVLTCYNHYLAYNFTNNQIKVELAIQVFVPRNLPYNLSNHTPFEEYNVAIKSNSTHRRTGQKNLDQLG